jgi:hypothetical protein
MSNRVFPLYQPDSARKLAGSTEDLASAGNQADEVTNVLDQSNESITFSEIKDFGYNSDSSYSHGKSPWNREDLQDNPGLEAPIIPFENKCHVDKISFIEGYEVASIAAEPQGSSRKAPSIDRSFSKLSSARSLQASAKSGSSVNGSSNLRLRSFGSSRNPLIEIIKQDIKQNNRAAPAIVSDEDKMKDLPYLYAFIAVLTTITFTCSYYEVGSHSARPIPIQTRR